MSLYMSFNSVQGSSLLDDQVSSRDILLKAASGMYLARVNNAENKFYQFEANTTTH